MKIGVISDTHNFFDSKIPKFFEGVDHILHAGDVGLPSIILQLEQIAPVTAVYGNTDSGLDLRETEIVELGGRKFLIHHIVDVYGPSDVFRRRFDATKPDVVVFGHTHQPFKQQIGSTLFLNPGSAGKKRFNLPRTLGILHCGKDLRFDLKPLE